MNNVRPQLMLWDSAPIGRGVRIAVLDTGVDIEHPDLEGAVDIKTSRSTISLSSDIVDRHGHGTHIAGIIAGRGVLNPVFRGIAPGAALVILKTATAAGGFESDAAAGVQAAIEAGVDIINYSHGHSPKEKKGPAPWVWPLKNSLIEDAFAEAADRGILCVAAAGNDGPNEGSVSRPGGLQSVLTVGAVNASAEVIQMSSRGPYRRLDLPVNGVRRFDAVMDRWAITTRKPDLVAPGDSVVATRAKHGAGVRYEQLLDPSDGACPYMHYSGTSMATAVVSGLAACLLQLARDNGIDLGQNPGGTLQKLLILGARPLARYGSSDCGNGLIKWPVVQATLADFANDAAFRDVVLDGNHLRLIE